MMTLRWPWADAIVARNVARERMTTQFRMAMPRKSVLISNSTPKRHFQAWRRHKGSVRRWPGRASPRKEALERQLETELDQTRVVHSRVDRAEARGAAVVDWQSELGVVKQVEEFGAEVQAHIFPGEL